MNHCYIVFYYFRSPDTLEEHEEFKGAFAEESRANSHIDFLLQTGEYDGEFMVQRTEIQ